MTIPLQHGSVGTTTILKAANVKTEGSHSTVIQQRTGSQVVGSPVVVCIYCISCLLASFISLSKDFSVLELSTDSRFCFTATSYPSREPKISSHSNFFWTTVGDHIFSARWSTGNRYVNFGCFRRLAFQCRTYGESVQAKFYLSNFGSHWCPQTG